MNDTPKMDASRLVPDLNASPLNVITSNDDTTSQRVEADLDTLDNLFQEVSAAPYDAFVQRRLFDPLRMSATGFPSSLPADTPMAKV